MTALEQDPVNPIPYPADLRRAVPSAAFVPDREPDEEPDDVLDMRWDDTWGWWG